MTSIRNNIDMRIILQRIERSLTETPIRVSTLWEFMRVYSGQSPDRPEFRVLTVPTLAGCIATGAINRI